MPKGDKWTPIIPVPPDVETPNPPNTIEKDHPAPYGAWSYYNEKSDLLGIACELSAPNLAPNSPIIKQPYLYLWGADADGNRRWEYVSKFPKPAPLFNLDLLSAHPDADVFVVSTERETDSITRLFPDVVAVTWQGREMDVARTDWRPLKDRKVWLWPANDLTARSTFDGVAKIVRKLAKECLVMTPPKDAPPWWSCMSLEKADGVRGCFAPLMEIPKPVVAPVPPPDPERFPFRCLGFDHGDYFYQPNGIGQVLRLAAAAHTKAQLLQLAPLIWWEASYPGPKGCSWDAAADALIRAQEKVGVYDHTKCRGRGVWRDGERTILHLGNRIFADGKETPVRDFKSSYIYEMLPSLDSPCTNPLTSKEASQFQTICASATWTRLIDCKYLAGWCVISTICGGLTWRPSIWITGPGGSGKTWIIDKIVAPMLGPMRLYAQGMSSEASLRQMLRNDALPVIIEEAEQDNKTQEHHLQGVLTLMRQSSSETGAKIYRGTTSGHAIEYCIRSTFCFGSIGVGARHYADQSRVTVLTLMKNDDREAFARLKQLVGDVITPEYASRFRARAFMLLPVIQQNAAIFSDVVGGMLRSKRIGDQIGILIAGAYSLVSESVITPERAHEWVQKQDWAEERAQDDMRDERACLDAILQIMVPVSDGQGRRDIQLIELVEHLTGSTSPLVSPSVAEEHLKRWGVRVDGEEGAVYISNGSTLIQKALKETAWHATYPRMLRRLKGAEPVARMRFTGFSTRSVRIPVATILATEGEGHDVASTES
jgi:putative DNA primase/helicase